MKSKQCPLQPYTKHKLQKWKNRIGEIYKAKLTYYEEDIKTSVILEHIKTKEKVIFT